ncbi:YusW family protein [Sporosarcina luteola]|uniref:YusW family protein n=1 Tax=Bacillales TaxID=1385 RepID=UPI00203CD42A|nr:MULTISPECIES: YusW family protein [Bacillales]MCM3638107.1 YusW family protein [Sporosarcina luteola]
MKKLTSIILACCFIVVSGCSNQNLVPKTEASDVVDTYGITSFTVTIDTNEEQEALTASFSEKKERSEAEYTNKKEEVALHGKKALKKIMEAFEKMQPDPESEETEMIKSAAEAFGFKEYKMIRLEVKFKGYDSKEIMFSK